MHGTNLVNIKKITVYEKRKGEREMKERYR